MSRVLLRAEEFGQGGDFRGLQREPSSYDGGAAGEAGAAVGASGGHG